LIRTAHCCARGRLRPSSEAEMEVPSAGHRWRTTDGMHTAAGESSERRRRARESLRRWRRVVAAAGVFVGLLVVSAGAAFGADGSRRGRLAGLEFGPKKNALIAVVVFGLVAGVLFLRRRSRSGRGR
jgi:hypothetical protein